MTTATITRPAQSIADAYRAAILRAHAETLTCEILADGTGRCKDYTQEFVGPRWSSIKCNCMAGQHGTPCKHGAGFIWLRKYGMCKVTFKPLMAKEVTPAIAESSKEDVADSLTLQAEIIRGMGGVPSEQLESLIAQQANAVAAASHILDGTRVVSGFDYYDAA